MPCQEGGFSCELSHVIRRGENLLLAASWRCLLVPREKDVERAVRGRVGTRWGVTISRLTSTITHTKRRLEPAAVTMCAGEKGSKDADMAAKDPTAEAPSI